MSVTEIVLIIIGGIILIAGYVLPKKKDKDQQSEPAVREDMVKELVSQEIDQAKSRIQDIVEETVSYSMEKTERAMERLSNEKIMSVNEYSDTVLESINKNHESVIFLYDMLNEKHDSLVKLVGEANTAGKKVQESVEDAKTLAAAVEAEESGEAEQKSKRSVPVRGRNGSGKSAGKKKRANADAADGGEPIAEEPPEEGFRPIAPPHITEEEITGDHPVNVLDMIEHQEQAAQEQELPDVDIQFAGGSNNNEKILALHKSGKSNTAIAKELELGVGEVKLVIDLFQSM